MDQYDVSWIGLDVDLVSNAPQSKPAKFMSELENADITNWDHLCVVCGQSVDQGGGMCHMKAGARMIALCFETFEQDPAKYLRCRAVRKVSDDKCPLGSFSLFDQ